jgi:hypothetical protein
VLRHLDFLEERIVLSDKYLAILLQLLLLLPLAYFENDIFEVETQIILRSS